MDWVTNSKSFIDVVDSNSFTKAAEKRFTSPAGISRRITWLEDHLGVTLLARTTRTLQLTEEGRFFYEKSKQLLASLEEITQQLQTRRQVLKGSIKITLPISFGGFAEIVNLFKAFLAHHPDIELNLDFSNQNHDLLAEEIDLAFRAGLYVHKAYVSRKITSLQMGIFATVEYLAKKGTPQAVAELVEHNCLQHQYIAYSEWEFKNQQKVAVTGNIRANASQPLIELGKAGLGIIRTLTLYVEDDLKNNTLQPVLTDHWPDPLDIYLIYRTGVTIPTRITAFAEFALEWFHKISLGN